MASRRLIVVPGEKWLERMPLRPLSVVMAWLAIPIVLRPGAVELIDAIAGAGQVVAVVVTGGAAIVIAVRRDQFDYQVIP